MVKYLCKSRANIEARDRWGYTPLLNSAYFNAGLVLEYLINSKANTTVENGNGNNALHLACIDRKSDIVQLLLAIPQTQLKKLIAKSNSNNETPLAKAVLSGDSQIVSQLFQSGAYFPQSPALGEIDLPPDSYQEVISSWLLTKFQEKKNEEKNKGHRNAEEKNLFSDQCISAVFCWAILNTKTDGHDKLVTFIYDQYHPKLPTRGISTPLHILALTGKPKMLQLIPDWELDILAGAEKKITPLHIAAKRGHFRFLNELLQFLKRRNGPQAVLDAILQETEDLDTLISLSASRGHSKLERWLWNMVFEITREDGSFQENSFAESSSMERSYQAASDSDDVKFKRYRNRQLVIGVATWRYTAGKGRYLQGFRNLMEGRHLNSTPPNSSSSVLEFLVDMKLPVGLWWLLSSGDHFDETRFKECERILKEYEQCTATRSTVQSNQRSAVKAPTESELVMKLLKNPPRQRMAKEEQGPPQFQYEKPSEDTITGTVLDVLVKQDTPVIFKHKRADIAKIAYDEGPEKLMSNNDAQSLDDIKTSLFPGRHAPLTSSDHQVNKEKESFSESGGFKDRFRWIHIPKNDVSVQNQIFQVLKNPNHLLTCDLAPIRQGNGDFPRSMD